MPDSTANAAVNWFSAVITVLIGYATKSVSEWLQHRRATSRERLQHQYATEREREAREAVRRDQFFERRNTFQRQTLLDLQQALFDLHRMTGKMHHQDVMEYRKTGAWQKQRFGDDLAENSRLANARTAMLAVRVRDESVRKLVQRFKNDCTAATMSANAEESEGAVRRAMVVFEELNQRTGEPLRKLDDNEDAEDRSLTKPV